MFNKNTGQFIVVSENAKCKSKKSASSQGTVTSPLNIQCNPLQVFKSTAIALAVALTTTTSFATTSNQTGVLGEFLTQIYTQFESKTNITLTDDQVSQLDNHYLGQYEYEIPNIVDAYRQDNPNGSIEDVLEYMRANSIQLSYESNNQRGNMNSWTSEGTGLTSFGTYINNHGAANIAIGIESNSIGFMNNVVGSSLQVKGDHNVVIGSNESTFKDAGGDVLNLQVLQRNTAKAGFEQTEYDSILYAELNRQYLDGTITLEQFVANVATGNFNLQNGTDLLPTVQGSYNTVLGSFNDVKGDRNTLLGNSTTVHNSNRATVVGNTNVITGDDNTVLGSGNAVNGQNNTIIGSNDISAFNAELARINATQYNDAGEKAADLANLADLYGSLINGDNLVAVGTGLKIDANNSVVVGNNVTNTADGVTVIGSNLTVDGTAPQASAYITGLTADNQVMFGGQRFTQILDGVDATDGVALNQIQTIASGYYEAHGNLVSNVDSLNLKTFQDEEKLFKEVAARIDTIKAEDELRIQGEIDTKFAESTATMAQDTLNTTMNGVEQGISVYAETKYQTLRSQALTIANNQNAQLNERATDTLNTTQTQALAELNAKLAVKSAQLSSGLKDIAEGKATDHLTQGQQAIVDASNTKKSEGIDYIQAEDNNRFNESVSYIDDLIGKAGTGSTGGTSSNTGLGSQDKHYDNLEDYAADQDTVLLSNTKDKTDNLIHQAKDDMQAGIDAAINAQVIQATDQNKVLDAETKQQLVADLGSKDAEVLAQTNDLTREIVSENLSTTRDLITAQDQVTLNSITTQTDANNSKTLTDLNNQFDRLDQVVLQSGKDALKIGDEQTYQNLQNHILVQDEKLAAEAEKLIIDSASITQTGASEYITTADTSIWDEFQKHLGTGGGVTDEASAIEYATKQDAKNLATLKIIADAKDQQVLQTAKDYADEKFVGLGEQISSRDAKIQAGVAGAYALSSLPQASYPGQAGTSWSMASKSGQSAVAFGYTMMTDDSKYLFKSGVSRDSKSNFSGGASVTRYILP